MEDSDQNIHLRNLSVHAAANEEEALNLLFLGDTNRMIAEVSILMENLGTKEVFVQNLIFFSDKFSVALFFINTVAFFHTVCFYRLP